MSSHTTTKWQAERKNRHLLETAHSLMLNSNVPTHHWGDAVLTACFLINRMPSFSLENQIPHSIVFPHDPLFHVSPKVFGCTCFVHDLSPPENSIPSNGFGVLTCSKFITKIKLEKYVEDHKMLLIYY